MITVEDLLNDLRNEGRINRLDIAFTRLMSRLGGGISPAVAGAIALASQASSSGQICIDLSALSGRHIVKEREIEFPACHELRRSLLKSGVVGNPGGYAPLILDDCHRLYLYRYWQYESALAAWLTNRAGETVVVDEKRLREGLSRYFPGEPSIRPDWQKVAAAVALLKPLCVISGGPGTGKTTTVLKILALLQGQSDGHAPRIALAAPTGKAAARLQQSISRSIDSLSLPNAARDALPREAFTLHRLLGITVDPMQFRHNRENPLPYDLVVVDEASMIDLSMMSKLVDAVAPRTRLILLGDKNQLASVEAGAVLADICGDSPVFSPPFRQRVAAIAGEPIPEVEQATAPMSDVVVTLRHSYRFAGESGIGTLADSINRGDFQRAQSTLASVQYPDVANLSNRGTVMERIVEGYRPYLTAIRERAPVPDIFAAFEQFRVLCGVRQGPFGILEFNGLIEQALYEAGLIQYSREGYPGMPVMVTRNDYNLRLFNGDIGILLPDEPGGQRVCFPGIEGEGRRFALSRLEAYETVFAMTVHKSQGSEFDDVMLILPETDSPLLTRELLYTAVTRSRRCFHLSAPPNTLEQCITRRLNRASGLGGALWPESSMGGNALPMVPETAHNRALDEKPFPNER